MLELSEKTIQLIQGYQAWQESLKQKEGKNTIHVDEVASRVAALYEKIRGILEWREEHFLRKQAIERILKRRLFLARNESEIAGPLILELIRGGHFPNNSIEEENTRETEILLRKYNFLWKSNPPQTRQERGLHNWLLEIAVCEIEEKLSPPLRHQILINFAIDFLKERLEIRKGSRFIKEIENKEIETQIFIAIQRAFFKFDEALISYNLLKTRFPQWTNLPQEQLEEIAQNILKIWQGIKKDLNHPFTEKFYKVCQRKSIAFLVLDEIIAKSPKKAEEILKTPEILEKEIKLVYSKRVNRLREALRRAALYSTISIFFTKMLLAFAAEVPLERYLTREINFLTLGINIFFPPLLMFLLVASIRTPERENSERLVMEISKIIHPSAKKEIFEIRVSRQRGFLAGLIKLFYLTTFVLSFGFILWLLRKMGFELLSIIIFLMFFSLISFAVVKIRERARNLRVIEKRDGFFIFLLDSFSLPFIQAGKWLSRTLSRYNFIMIFFDLLIEMPLQVFIVFLEQWRYFLKEKKEEIH